MAASIEHPFSNEELVTALRESDAYPYEVDSPIVVHQTHISWVFLVGQYAYKVKKPIKTSFLDYSTLDRRHYFCQEEVRLDSRYTEGMYLAVVPITRTGGRVRVEGDGDPIEFAVKMRRFPEDALLSDRLAKGTLTTEEVFGLATAVANFHSHAERLAPNQSFGSPELVFTDAMDNLRDLQENAAGGLVSALHTLSSWTQDYFAKHEPEFMQRVANGFIRECHGDLHLANIVHWKDQLIPFDGIEFNKGFRWIDVLSDASFLAMDLAARGHLDLCRSFINSYLEQTGDHASLSLLRWYLVYRCLVRAKVARLRANQDSSSDDERAIATDDITSHIDLAYRFTLREEPRLWITHGVSGSGKTTLSEVVVQRHGAIRLRSDIERKRHFGISPTERPDESLKKKLYCESATHATYERLRRLTHGILHEGYSVVVDATFLKQRERKLFRELAQSEGVSFAILDCHSDDQTLRQRVADRMARNDDASDADLTVLDHQLASYESLTDAERRLVVNVPDVVETVTEL